MNILKLTSIGIHWAQSIKKWARVVNALIANDQKALGEALELTCGYCSQDKEVRKRLGEGWETACRRCPLFHRQVCTDEWRRGVPYWEVVHHDSLEDARKVLAAIKQDDRWQ